VQKVVVQPFPHKAVSKYFEQIPLSKGLSSCRPRAYAVRAENILFPEGRVLEGPHRQGRLPRERPRAHIDADCKAWNLRHKLWSGHCRGRSCRVPPVCLKNQGRVSLPFSRMGTRSRFPQKNWHCLRPIISLSS